MAYAMYIHGLGSGGGSGTRSSLGHYLNQYEWLSPELPTDPQAAYAILLDYAQVFTPELVVGTSLGGLYTLYVPASIKVAVNPTYNIDTILRRVGYGRHPYHCQRDDGATEYHIDEPLVQAYRHFRDNTAPVASPTMIALFSTDDEVVGREASKQNARAMQSHGYTPVWYNKFGHRLNQQAAKYIAQLIAI